MYLKLRYLLTECVDDDMYKAVEYDEEAYVSNHYHISHRNDIHGPAVLSVKSGFLSCDIVRSVRCLVWPPQAAAWPTDTETTAGQTQQLLIVLSTTDVMWFLWHIVSVDKTNGWASVSTDCHSHEQKLYL